MNEKGLDSSSETEMTKRHKKRNWIPASAGMTKEERNDKVERIEKRKWKTAQRQE
ncbi:hypothetical protein [Candidatus Magnetomonas plexicatena]|uniref:hypothetical protein n=1 Tax=Candidatus Magnetomonas plexicatena TaxID=2552947 RepID=UPI001C783164|nr:hypothetical protein E2O03_003450 [Nitrospirales bacterium LBB_01]